jgi:hypothetical protein
MTRRAAAGRHDLARVPEQAGGYAVLPASVNNTSATIAPVAISDPYDQQRRVRASARIDLLDRERRRRFLDEASYRVGREVEAIFEDMGRIGGGGQWLEGDRIEASIAAELRAVLGVERAYRVNVFLGWLVRHIGKSDTRLLWLVLGHRMPFSLAAAAFGRRGIRGLRYTMDRFRDALAILAEAKAARGRGLR